MSNLTVYFDASGNRRDPNVRFLFVSGLLATEHSWLRFQPVWAKFVKKCGMDHFRMSKFWHLWRDRPDERDALLQEGAAIINRFTRKSFSSGVDLAAHREFEGAFHLPPEFESPLAIAGVLAVRNTVKHLSRKVEVLRRMPLLLFENGDLDKGKLIWALENIDPVLTPSFGEKADHPGLQAGDLLAWHHARTLTKGEMPSGNAMTIIGRRLRQGDDSWTYSDRAWYENHSKKWEPRR